MQYNHLFVHEDYTTKESNWIMKNNIQLTRIEACLSFAFIQFKYLTNLIELDISHPPDMSTLNMLLFDLARNCFQSLQILRLADTLESNLVIIGNKCKHIHTLSFLGVGIKFIPKSYIVNHCLYRTCAVYGFRSNF